MLTTGINKMAVWQDGEGLVVERDRDREIEVLELAKRVSAELDSGRVEDVDMAEERVARIRSLLLPPPQPGSVQQTLTQDH